MNSRYEIGVNIGELRESQRRTEAHLAHLHTRLELAERSIQTFKGSLPSLMRSPPKSSTGEAVRSEFLHSILRRFGPAAIRWAAETAIKWILLVVAPMFLIFQDWLLLAWHWVSPLLHHLGAWPR